MYISAARTAGSSSMTAAARGGAFSACGATWKGRARGATWKGRARGATWKGRARGATWKGWWRRYTRTDCVKVSVCPSRTVRISANSRVYLGEFSCVSRRILVCISAHSRVHLGKFSHACRSVTFGTIRAENAPSSGCDGEVSTCNGQSCGARVAATDCRAASQVRDTAEIQPRYSRDTAEIQPR